MKPPYVIYGATGHIGSQVVDTLLADGEAVRLIGRDRVRLGPLAGKEPSRGPETWGTRGF
jgi:uncharacterized protein YbjT (DUF2867 family)